MPLQVQGHTVPHLKALISEPRGLRCDSNVRICQALLKSVVLLHREGLVKTAVPITVTEAVIWLTSEYVSNYDLHTQHPL